MRSEPGGSTTWEAYCQGLEEMGPLCPNLVVVDASRSSVPDRGFVALCPDRFFPAGVSEQDLVLTAAGLALGGKTVFASSCAPFLVGRAYDRHGARVVGHQQRATLVRDVLQAAGLDAEPLLVQRPQRREQDAVGQFGVESGVIDLILPRHAATQERERGRHPGVPVHVLLRTRQRLEVRGLFGHCRGAGPARPGTGGGLLLGRRLLLGSRFAGFARQRDHARIRHQLPPYQ